VARPSAASLSQSEGVRDESLRGSNYTSEQRPGCVVGEKLPISDVAREHRIRGMPGLRSGSLARSLRVSMENGCIRDKSSNSRSNTLLSMRPLT
jgi:hypothetical protein